MPLAQPGGTSLDSAPHHFSQEAILSPICFWGPFHWVQNVSSVSVSAATQQAHRHAITMATAMPPAFVP